jgi:outer membrane lipoprotein-sorting protein
MRKTILSVLAVCCVIGMTGAAKKPTAATTPIPTGQIEKTVQAEVIKPGNKKISVEGQALMEAQQGIGDLTANFALIIAGAGKNGDDFTAQGKMWLTTGRQYAVQYEQPERQRLVSNGAKRWLYLEKINQVQIQSLPPAGNPNDFFLELGGGLPALIKQCDVTLFAVEKSMPGVSGYTLIPRPGVPLSFSQAQLWVKGKYLVPVRVVVQAARQVRVEFSDVKIHTLEELVRDPGKGVPTSTFRFEPPKDAEVIEMF